MWYASPKSKQKTSPRSRVSRSGGAGIVLPAKALNADEVVVNDVPLTELAYGLGLADLAFGYEIAESVRAS